METYFQTTRQEMIASWKGLIGVSLYVDGISRKEDEDVKKENTGIKLLNAM